MSERNKQVRAHILAQRKARTLTPGLRDMLAAWDAAQADAKALLAAQQRAYRDPARTLSLAADVEPSDLSPAWQATLDGLAPTEV
ncbi:hypothetical protein [Burkholderia sp. Ax-1724]|uniref:hypothetical protein n=1 Tax=Burkholderia sp. Ax-1724 TaxID=2608336 RepID=UPI00141F5F8B|nr:hypothetical protein [Burkholderia sp. Ax-1724]NIF54970.1 hypothetical protein [Burkholderia sp. Ax-1724]